MDGSQLSAQLADIQRTLGTLLAESKANAAGHIETSEQIVRVHERIDDLREDFDTRFRQLEASVIGNNHLAAETEAKVEALTGTVNDDIRPQTEEFAKLRAMGSGFLFAAGIAGAIAGMTFSDAVKMFFTALRRAFN